MCVCLWVCCFSLYRYEVVLLSHFYFTFCRWTTVKIDPVKTTHSEIGNREGSCQRILWAKTKKGKKKKPINKTNVRTYLRWGCDGLTARAVVVNCRPLPVAFVWRPFFSIFWIFWFGCSKHFRFFDGYWEKKILLSVWNSFCITCRWAWWWANPLRLGSRVQQVAQISAYHQWPSECYCSYRSPMWVHLLRPPTDCPVSVS